MNGQRQDPTQDELDFLYRHGFEWVSRRESGNQWLFKQTDGVFGEVFDLSAADILQIETIKERRLFVVKPAPAKAR